MKTTLRLRSTLIVKITLFISSHVYMNQVQTGNRTKSTTGMDVLSAISKKISPHTPKLLTKQLRPLAPKRV